MRIGVFAYNFEHKKTQEGLFELFASGYKPSCILAADPVPLNFYKSQRRISPKGLRYLHPSVIAEALSIPYHIVRHNSKDACELVKRLELDLGIILGARILKSKIINAFQKGILNLHPGWIPEVRGLDSIKWAISEDKPLGVTAHLITPDIDHGPIVKREKIEIFKDDSLMDIFLRIQNLELILMKEAIHAIEVGASSFPMPESGTYYKSMPVEIESRLDETFENYKRRYAR